MIRHSERPRGELIGQLFQHCRPQRLPEAAIVRRQQDVLLGLEIIEESPARDAGGLRDGLERGAVITVLHEQFQTLSDDPLGRLPPLAFRRPCGRSDTPSI